MPHDEVEALIGQWIAKAESDLKSACAILKLRKDCPPAPASGLCLMWIKY